MQVQLVSTFPTKNLTLAIAWKGKNSVFVIASMPWSQLMVPRRERWDQGFLDGIFVDLLLYQTIKSSLSMKSYFNHRKLVSWKMVQTMQKDGECIFSFDGMCLCGYGNDTPFPSKKHSSYFKQELQPLMKKV